MNMRNEEMDYSFDHPKKKIEEVKNENNKQEEGRTYLFRYFYRHATKEIRVNSRR